MYDRDWGYVLSSEPQTLRQCLNFYRCHSTSTNQQAGDEIGREILEYIYNFLVSLQRKNTRASSFHHCFTILRSRRCGILRSHECGIIFTCLQRIIWWRKTGMLIFFYCAVAFGVKLCCVRGFWRQMPFYILLVSGATFWGNKFYQSFIFFISFWKSRGMLSKFTQLIFCQCSKNGILRVARKSLRKEKFLKHYLFVSKLLDFDWGTHEFLAINFLQGFQSFIQRIELFWVLSESLFKNVFGLWAE